MNQTTVLRIDGLVEQPLDLTVADLLGLEPERRVTDLLSVGYRRSGEAIRLQTLLGPVRVKPEADHLGLHASADDFHASIPLAAVIERGLLIVLHDGRPLTAKEGGPLRFFIPDHTACRADEIDECANVKFVDRIELTAGKGLDNRPADEAAHRRLHAAE